MINSRACGLRNADSERSTTKLNAPANKHASRDVRIVRAAMNMAANDPASPPSRSGACRLQLLEPGLADLDDGKLGRDKEPVDQDEQKRERQADKRW